MGLEREIFAGIKAAQGVKNAFDYSEMNYRNELYKAAKRENDIYDEMEREGNKAVEEGRPSTPAGPPGVQTTAAAGMPGTNSPNTPYFDPRMYMSPSMWRLAARGRFPMGTPPFNPNAPRYAEGGSVRQAFNPEGPGYDYRTATDAGLGPDETGHWPSREPRSGALLKGRAHPTFDKGVDEDRRKGYGLEKKDGRYYTQPMKGYRAGGMVREQQAIDTSDPNVARGYRPKVKDEPARAHRGPFEDIEEEAETPESDTYEPPAQVPEYGGGEPHPLLQRPSFRRGGPVPNLGKVGRDSGPDEEGREVGDTDYPDYLRGNPGTEGDNVLPGPPVEQSVGPGERGMSYEDLMALHKKDPSKYGRPRWRTPLRPPKGPAGTDVTPPLALNTGTPPAMRQGDPQLRDDDPDSEAELVVKSLMARDNPQTAPLTASPQQEQFDPNEGEGTPLQQSGIPADRTSKRLEDAVPAPSKPSGAPPNVAYHVQGVRDRSRGLPVQYQGGGQAPQEQVGGPPLGPPSPDDEIDRMVGPSPPEPAFSLHHDVVGANAAEEVRRRRGPPPEPPAAMDTRPPMGMEEQRFIESAPEAPPMTPPRRPQRHNMADLLPLPSTRSGVPFNNMPPAGDVRPEQPDLNRAIGAAMSGPTYAGAKPDISSMPTSPGGDTSLPANTRLPNQTPGGVPPGQPNGQNTNGGGPGAGNGQRQAPPAQSQQAMNTNAPTDASKRKALRDQTRIERYDPTLDAQDPDNIRAVDASGRTYTDQDLGNLITSAASVARPGPNGQPPIIGQGAVRPQTLDAFTAPGQRQGLSKGEALLTRMISNYRVLMKHGRVQQASMMAYGLMQAANVEAAAMGQTAMRLYQQGDTRGATQKMVDGINMFPDGKQLVVNEDGSVSVTDPYSKQVLHTGPVTGQQLLAGIMGLQDGTAFWQALQASAAMFQKPDRDAENRALNAEIKRRQIKILDNKIANPGGGRRGGASQAPSEASQSVNARIAALGGGGATAAPSAQGDTVVVTPEDNSWMNFGNDGVSTEPQ